MKILEANAGVLTNFEVLDFLKSRGAGKDPTRVMTSVTPSEYKVYDYLEGSAASHLTKENVVEFMDKLKKYKLAKAEMLNIINIRPSSHVEIDTIVEDGERRYGENLLVEMVDIVAPPTETEPDEEIGEEETTAGEEQQIEA